MGELKNIKGADKHLEIGAVTQLNSRQPAPSAVLFDGIPGFPPSYAIVTGAVSKVSRIALTLNLPVDLSSTDIIQVLREKLPAWRNNLAGSSPQTVATGPVMENVRSGKDVNLDLFPAPKWNELDGGNYLGTGCVVITRDMASGGLNLGCYRNQAHDRSTVGLSITPERHGRVHYEKYHAAGKPCPVAISLGHDPLLFILAGTSFPHLPYSEYEAAGAIRGSPVKVITEELTGLPVPADSEIVLAGWCPPGETRMEGPFGEFLGYYGAMAEPAPVIKVERVYFRNNPIILGAPPGRPPGDYGLCSDLVDSANLFNFLETSGVPDVKGVWISEEARKYLVIVSIRQRYAGHAKQAALLASQFRATAFMGRFVIVVDEDIDPSNTHQVLWALCTRCDVKKNIDIVRDLRGIPLDPIVKKPARHYSGARAFINACKPFEWIEGFPKEITVRPEIERHVREKWGNFLGLG